MTFLAIILAATLSSGNAEFDDFAREGARKIALRRAADEIEEKGPPAGVLEKAMLAEPGKFAKAADAKRLCREVFEREAKEAFAAKANAIDARLGLGSNRVGLESNRVELVSDRIGVADRVDAVDPNSTLKDPKRPYLTLNKIVERHFEKTFENERKSAVERQAKGLVAAMRPAERDFDMMDDGKLRAMMVDRILKEQKTPVFEENRQFVSERMVDPVIADARREQKRQAEYLMRARTDAYAPSALKRDLRARLEDNVKDRRTKAEDPAKAWGVFAGTFERSIDSAVERRTLSRIERRIDACEVKVDVASVLKAIAENPRAHVKAGASEAIFRERYSSEMLSGAVAAACAEAPAPEREEFGEYARKHLDAERIAKSVEQRLQKDVLPKWRKARAEAAALQAAETWPGLEDGTWHPDPELADETAARSDYSKAVRNWRRAKGMEALADAAKGRSVLEEADKRADVRVAAAFDIARGAIAAQNGIVEGCHKTVLEESRRRKDSFWTRTPDLKAVTELLTRATEEEWDRTRMATLWPDEASRPGNAAEQHRELFPSVRRKIELLAKVILEEMNEQRPEQEKKPEEPPPEDKPDEPEEPLDLIAISVERKDGRVEVELKRGNKTIRRASASSRKGDFEGAMRKITDALSDLLKLPE